MRMIGLDWMEIISLSTNNDNHSKLLPNALYSVLLLNCRVSVKRSSYSAYTFKQA